MIIGINGKIGSGKDTIGEIIQGLSVTNGGRQFEIKKFAGKLKQIASLLTGIPIEDFEDQEFKTTNLGAEWDTELEYVIPMTVREFLQKLGTEAMRNGLHTNVWVNALFADYRGPKMSEYNPSNWIITDMRFPNELEAVVERKGITIRVVRPKIESVVDKMRPYSDLVHYGIPMPVEHPSETALDDAKFHYEIINDGSIKDLIEKVKQILITEKII
jgi:hypothetical protein